MQGLVFWPKVNAEAVFLVILGTSSFPARTNFSILLLYTSCPAGIELVPNMTKNTASATFDFSHFTILGVKIENLSWTKNIFNSQNDQAQ